MELQSSAFSQVTAQNLLRERLVYPLLKLLRKGATPNRLAWSLAIGCVVGVNPLLGSTTLLALLLAYIFRLNIVASQLANHAVYPLELILFPLFIKAGSLAFHAKAFPLRIDQMIHEVKLHPVETTRLLWAWQWHALVVWAVFAVVTAPLLAIGLRPVLVKMVNKMSRERQSAIA